MNSNMFGSDKYSKIKNTTLEHYGVDCIFKDKDLIDILPNKISIQDPVFAYWIKQY